jgi:hypothetical protein
MDSSRVTVIEGVIAKRKVHRISQASAAAIGSN